MCTYISLHSSSVHSLFLLALPHFAKHATRWISSASVSTTLFGAPLSLPPSPHLHLPALLHIIVKVSHHLLSCMLSVVACTLVPRASNAASLCSYQLSLHMYTFFIPAAVPLHCTGVAFVALVDTPPTHHPHSRYTVHTSPMHYRFQYVAIDIHWQIIRHFSSEIF